MSSNLIPCSTIFNVINLLRKKNLTQKQIIEQLTVDARTVRYALSRLLKDGIILQRASLFDARQSYYEVKV